MTLRQLLLLHRGAVEQRWAEVAWTCAMVANIVTKGVHESIVGQRGEVSDANRILADDKVYQPDEFNPLRQHEVAAATGGPEVRQRGSGVALDRETIRAMHQAFREREERQRREGKPGRRGPPDFVRKESQANNDVRRDDRASQGSIRGPAGDSPGGPEGEPAGAWQDRRVPATAGPIQPATAETSEPAGRAAERA